MAPPNHDPLILLAFADPSRERVGTALQVDAERRGIEAELLSKKRTFHTLSKTTRTEIFDRFDRFEDQLVAFHFGGHGHIDRLLIEDTIGASADAMMRGVAAGLGGLPSLRFIFLNACVTNSHREILRAYCPGAALILADGAIADGAAVSFAIRIYRGLAAGRSVESAYREASSERLSQPDSDDGIRFLRPADGPVRLDWTLYGSDPARAWRLTDGANGSPGDALLEHVRWAFEHLHDSDPKLDRRLAQALVQQIASAEEGVAEASLIETNVDDAIADRRRHHLEVLAAEPYRLVTRMESPDGRHTFRAEAPRLRAVLDSLAPPPAVPTRILAMVALSIVLACALAYIIHGWLDQTESSRRSCVAQSGGLVERAACLIETGMRPADAAERLDPSPDAIWDALRGPRQLADDALEVRVHLALLARVVGQLVGDGRPAAGVVERYGLVLSATDRALLVAGNRGDRALAERALATQCQVRAQLRQRVEPAPGLLEALRADVRPLPGGWFVRGSPTTEVPRIADEAERVSGVAPFGIGRNPVSRAQLNAFFASRRYATRPVPGGREPAEAELPGTEVDWYEARVFAEWTGMRLLTEAEWEFAARDGGRATGRYCTGDTLSATHAHLKGDHPDPFLHPIRSLEPCGGLYAMHANVPTWCADWFHETYGWFRVYDPRGPVWGEERVRRGGGPRDEGLSALRSARRHAADPHDGSQGVGVRLALDAAACPDAPATRRNDDRSPPDRAMQAPSPGPG